MNHILGEQAKADKHGQQKSTGSKDEDSWEATLREGNGGVQHGHIFIKGRYVGQPRRSHSQAHTARHLKYRRPMKPLLAIMVRRWLTRPAQDSSTARFYQVRRAMDVERRTCR